MGKDLVERLRHKPAYHSWSECWPLNHEAADSIEKLSKGCFVRANMIRDLEAKVERLEAALQKIADTKQMTQFENYVQKTAREALNKKQP